jgi:S-DNA-T family DNA segregation ATPase FtsK/SpoIIIE
MAKKKRQTRKKKIEPVEQSPFWPLAGAVLLFVLALFLLLGGFGTGGPLPLKLFEGTYLAFGWAAYIVPVAFIYWGIYKFTTEDHRIPIWRLLGMLGVLLFAAGWLHTAFDSGQAYIASGGQSKGGATGELLGVAALSVLDTFPAAVMFFIFGMLAVFFAFGISPLVLLNLKALFQRETDDTDLADLKAKAETGGFKLNEGVPVEHGKAGRFGSLKNTAEKLAPAANHEALTTASDPDWKFPGLNLLDQKQDKADAGDVNANAQTIRDTFSNFNIDVEMEGANVGPRVTQYTLKPPTGVKLTKITALDNNLALDLAAHAIRIEAPIPGKRGRGSAERQGGDCAA